MEGQTIATARIDIVGDASGVEVATAKAKASITKMSNEARAQYGQLDRAERRRVDSLMRQAQAASLSHTELNKLVKELNLTGPLLDEINKRAGFGATSLMRLAGAATPIGVAALALGAMAAAAYQGSKELVELRNHLTMTNGALGMSVSQLSEVAASLGKLEGITRSAAVGALTEVAKSGKVVAEQIAIVSEVAIRSNQLLGREVSDVVAEFAALADEPTKASAKLNEQYNYLTASVYEQISALERQGDRQGAAQLAQETFANVTKERLAEVEASLGSVEKAWRAAGNWASQAWDSFKGLGRESTSSDILTAQEKQIEMYVATIQATRGAWVGMSTSDVDKIGSMPGHEKKALLSAIKGREEILLQQTQLRSELAGEEFVSAAKQENARLERESIMAAEDVRAIIARTLPKAEKAQKELAEYRANLEKIRRTNPASELLEPDSIKRAEKAILEKYKEAGGSKKAYSNDAATRLLLTLRQQEASLRGQVEGSEKLTHSQKQLLGFDQQIADIKNKKILTADERSLLASEQKIRKQLEVNVAVETEAKAREASLKFQERAAQIAQQMASARLNQNEQYQQSLDALGLGDKAAERVQAQRSIYKEFERYQKQLSLEASKGHIDSGSYRNESEKIQAELRRRLAMQDSYYVEMDRRQQSWVLGASQGFSNYSDGAANAFQTVGALAANSFKGMEDALLSFVRTGKTDFSSLADSIISDMLRIVAQQSITGPLANLAGSALGSMFGSGGSGNLSGVSLSGAKWGASYGLSAPASPGLVGIGTFSFSSGGFTGEGGRYEPAGIVHKGEGVLNQDEIRALGGEAGFNLLRRAIRGSERSTAPTMGGAVLMGKGNVEAPIINVSVHGAQGEPEVSARRNQSGGFDLDILLEKMESKMAAGVSSGQGKLGRSIERRFSLAPQLG
ncbi:phage tail tape measure protein [Alcaligenes endophyticus]|uniref:Phage tail tape measure protein n=1 Tax=Alcaligenes endophyticus TaxID=1929088 RepID=A0ABT8EKK1_9BURK|nr:phage tail tape measure protein [Alcaligenes endophyticus]MCX5592022.1 phage tail tape measure protein [Alcaligenes endophyticus]MDN4121712.1 phage tail tape measure protein [Alcaligenes endophyticus]